MIYSYRVEQALRAMTILHKDQVRKGPVAIPYSTHLFAVALIVADYTDNEDVFITALLHDTLEDTDYTSAELEEDFGGVVREYVEALTEPQDSDKKEYTWKERKHNYTKKLKNAPQEALLVAAADKMYNMRTMVEDYFDDHPRFLAEFGGSLDDRVLMYQDMANTLNRNLKSDIIGEFNHVFTEYKNFIADVKRTKEAQDGY